MIDLESLQWILIITLMIITMLLALHISSLRQSFDLLESLVMHLSAVIDDLNEEIKHE